MQWLRRKLRKLARQGFVLDRNREADMSQLKRILAVAYGRTRQTGVIVFGRHVGAPIVSQPNKEHAIEQALREGNVVRQIGNRAELYH